MIEIGSCQCLQVSFLSGEQEKPQAICYMRILLHWTKFNFRQPTRSSSLGSLGNGPSKPRCCAPHLSALSSSPLTNAVF